MKNTLICITLLFLSLSVNSAVWTNGVQEIKHIIWIPGMHGFYVTPSSFHDPQGCNNNDNLYLFDPTMDEKTTDRLYSMVLTAFSSGKLIYARVEGCELNKPKVVGLQINM